MLLTTERLLLRELEPDDWQATREYQADPRCLHYTEWTERPEADVRAFVQMFLDQQHEQPRHLVSRHQGSTVELHPVADVPWGRPTNAA